VIKPIDTTYAMVRDSFASLGLDRISTRLGIALLVVSGLFFSANFADKAWVSYQVAQQKAQLIATIQQTQQQITTYSSDLKFMHTRAYYVEAARDFGFVQPGDIPVSITTISPPANSSGSATHPAAASPAPTPATQQPSVFTRIMQAIVPGF
jgi:cell division protein FtsB